MADRPAFQFYPGDWKRNANLRRCSPAARGAWVDVLCLMHDSDEYGVLRWPLKEIANAAGIALKLLRELVDKGVLKGDDKNYPGYTFSPTHAGKKGEPVQLLEPTMGEPCWFSSRFVRDEYIRLKRAGLSQNIPPKIQPKPPFGEDKQATLGEHQSGNHSRAGPSSAVAVASSTTDQLPAAAIARTWWPCDETFKSLKMIHGYAYDWIDLQVPSFVAYWADRNEPRTSFDALFIDHCQVKAKSLRSVS
jgi:hypothetical protein